MPRTHQSEWDHQNHLHHCYTHAWPATQRHLGAVLYMPTNSIALCSTTGNVLCCTKRNTVLSELQNVATSSDSVLGQIFVMVLSYHSNDVDVFSLLLDCAFGVSPSIFLLGCKQSYKQ